MDSAENIVYAMERSIVSLKQQLTMIKACPVDMVESLLESLNSLNGVEEISLKNMENLLQEAIDSTSLTLNKFKNFTTVGEKLKARKRITEN